LVLRILCIDEGEVTLINTTHGVIVFRERAAIQKVDDSAKVHFALGNVLPQSSREFSIPQDELGLN
jgi:hypothetical protein